MDCRGMGPVTLRSPRGVLGSVTTEETGCGNTENPWVIQLQPGQRINITLMDFGIDALNRSSEMSNLVSFYTSH